MSRSLSLWQVALAASLWTLAQPALRGEAPGTFRPPAIPLVTHDPYFSGWSMTNRATDGWARHWTGSIQAMCGLVRVDGKTYRVLGPDPTRTPAMEQVGLEVFPTRTVYDFEAGGIRLTLTFTSPLLPHDLDILARPVTYLTWDARSADGRPHAVAIYFDASAEWAVDTPDQKVAWSRSTVGDLAVLRVGAADQRVLNRAGDNLRIDWGHFYLAVPDGGKSTEVVARDKEAREGFAATGTLPKADDPRSPRAANDEWPVLACAFDLGDVGKEAVSRHVLLAYDELFAVEYLHQKLRPYWRRNGLDAAGLLKAAEADYEALRKRCREFDEALMADLEKAGGRHYTRLAALAYRECLAANGLAAAPDGSPWLFPKENFSNGCIATVDVIYPAAPFFLLFDPKLLEAQLAPVLDYARSGRWKHAFAPHDLGTYPLANGQVYGGGEQTEKDQMPVEECGNMLLMVAAVARAEGNADFAKKYWPPLVQWAEYLKAKGLNPENQLCTDDFAGHLAHNTNLSLKAIEALGGFAMLCKLAGKPDAAASYRKAAEEMAAKWTSMADDGDHYRLAFDKPGTWSQKYNLVWDHILGLDLFPPEVARKEVAFYLAHQDRYGLPLDNRKPYTKLDWLVWTATMAESRKDFEALIEPAYRFAEQTPDRVPLTDWYGTQDAKQQGFQARSVVGGIFIKMLADPATWKTWLPKG